MIGKCGDNVTGCAGLFSGADGKLASICKRCSAREPINPLRRAKNNDSCKVKIINNDGKVTEIVRPYSIVAVGDRVTISYPKQEHSSWTQTTTFSI